LSCEQHQAQRESGERLKKAGCIRPRPGCGSTHPPRTGREGNGTGSYYLDPGPSASESAVTEARERADEERRAVRLELYRVRDPKVWCEPEYEFVVKSGTEPVAYALDWSAYSGGREPVRRECECSEVLPACDLEWPE
jgi:hypothetical protein